MIILGKYDQILITSYCFSDTMDITRYIYYGLKTLLKNNSFNSKKHNRLIFCSSTFVPLILIIASLFGLYICMVGNQIHCDPSEDVELNVLKDFCWKNAKLESSRFNGQCNISYTNNFENLSMFDARFKSVPVFLLGESLEYLLIPLVTHVILNFKVNKIFSTINPNQETLGRKFMNLKKSYSFSRDLICDILIGLLALKSAFQQSLFVGDLSTFLNTFNKNVHLCLKIFQTMINCVYLKPSNESFKPKIHANCTLPINDFYIELFYWLQTLYLALLFASMCHLFLQILICRSPKLRIYILNQKFDLNKKEEKIIIKEFVHKLSCDQWSLLCKIMLTCDDKIFEEFLTTLALENQSIC